MKISGARCLKKALARLNSRGVILMYHRVVELNYDPWLLSVSPVRFEEHMKVLKKYGRTVQMREMGEKLKRFSIGRKEIVITFDDGYADNFHNAKPILERHEIKATFFVASGIFTGREELWWDELERIIFYVKTLPQSFEMFISGTKYHWPLSLTGDSRVVKETPPNGIMVSRAQLYYALWQILSKLSQQEKKETLHQVAQWAGQSSVSRPDNLYMTSEELVFLSRSPLFEIGAHTVSHPLLSRIPQEKQKEEIALCKKHLKNMLGNDITSFSYPHGDYSDITVKLVKELGFRCACTIEQASVKRHTDIYCLPRFKVLDWSGDEFEQYLRNCLQE